MGGRKGGRGKQSERRRGERKRRRVEGGREEERGFLLFECIHSLCGIASHNCLWWSLQQITEVNNHQQVYFPWFYSVQLHYISSHCRIYQRMVLTCPTSPTCTVWGFSLGLTSISRSHSLASLTLTSGRPSGKSFLPQPVTSDARHWSWLTPSWASSSKCSVSALLEIWWVVAKKKLRELSRP